MPLAFADDELNANVAISVQQQGELWRGQQVTLNLDLKTTGFSFSDTHFNLPEVNGAFLMQTDTTTIKLTENIDGESWQIIRYPLALYPQKTGELQIPSIDVRFSSSAGFNSAQKSFEFKTTPLQITVSSPPGTNQQDLVITTPGFELDHSWQPHSGAAKTGDAITLTVTRHAEDISAMLLPPLPVFQAEGLEAYPQAPEIKDKTDRGDLTGERVDSIIWVVEQPGKYAIPGIRFQWWDPDSRELKQQIVPGLTLDVPLSATVETEMITGDKPRQSSNGYLWFLLLVLLASAGLALWRYSARDAITAPIESEKSTFDALRNACKNNDARQAYTALNNWLAWVSPVNTLSEFARTCSDTQLGTELEQLQEALIDSESIWQGNLLFKSVQQNRSAIMQQSIVQSKRHLAPLNP